MLSYLSTKVDLNLSCMKDPDVAGLHPMSVSRSNMRQTRETCSRRDSRVLPSPKGRSLHSEKENPYFEFNVGKCIIQDRFFFVF